ncbi:MAG: hypothetical protein PVG14_18450, partial [Anaerolineales bacterium]
ALILSSCSQEPSRPEGAITSAELLAEPVYNTPLKVYGQVSGLGVFECPCFALKSGGERIYVWYDMMVEEEGSVNPLTRTPVDVGGIENDDWIVVTGELKYFENRKKHEDFWLTEFKVINNV